ncbi:MAG: copper chaperone PCu(A)C [Gammaproteobacteria bacterium]|jgi:periplasmic copper chaperone A|nr:copper chaperone PCu(A)C [Gammaproteobacteria bacterium]MBU2181174.1 copper chaperone PCu(A)C [Gammaproteobacteria bacterium]MBU2223692.1 copper chaperone PCu(A)C [Gammaproteobacteria bacterium]MBU2278152.1 copper chaperone PCu(A)C [Gammaproteobacteria bacterium]MBU2428217.1 copper chaperone PCu(A)C [Gammaproteobacteria bacterium]
MRWRFLIVAFAASFQLMAAEVQIINSTVRLPLPGRSVSAGYLTINNLSDQAVSVVAATSPWFEKVELHQHSYVDGMMRMQQIDRIVIAPNQTVHLQPGGLHMMLFTPKQSLALDQQVPIELQLDNGQKISVSAVVTKIPKQ